MEHMLLLLRERGKGGRRLGWSERRERKKEKNRKKYCRKKEVGKGRKGKRDYSGHGITAVCHRRSSHTLSGGPTAAEAHPVGSSSRLAPHWPGQGRAAEGLL